MKPTSCTLLLSIFISTSLHVSGNYVPIIRRTYSICATLVFFFCSVWMASFEKDYTEKHGQQNIKLCESYVYWTVHRLGS